MQHLLLALELQQGQFPSSDGWIEDLSDMTQGSWNYSKSW